MHPPPVRHHPILALGGLLVATLAALGCGSEQPAPSTAHAVAGGDGSPPLECPPPIGRVPRESCAMVADEFGALSVAGALKVAGSGPEAAPRAAAIRAAGALANALKERRVALCEAYDGCKVPPADHAAEDARLAELMTALFAAWDKRQLAAPGGAEKLHDDVRALRRRFDGSSGDEAPGTVAAAPLTAPKERTISGESLTRVADAAVQFKAAAGAVTAVSAANGSRRDVLTADAKSLGLEPGHRYQLRVNGDFSAPRALGIVPGDRIAVRLAYRADEAAELSITLRSLEDVDWNEARATKSVGRGQRGTFEATLDASTSGSGVYVAISAEGGLVTIDDVEIARGGAALAAARAEDEAEAHVATSCARDDKKPIAGKRSFRCAATTKARDLMTVGAPLGFLTLALRGGGTSVRTTSLDGGRSLDARIQGATDLSIGIDGAGTVTIRNITVRPIVESVGDASRPGAGPASASAQ